MHSVELSGNQFYEHFFTNMQERFWSVVAWIALFVRLEEWDDFSHLKAMMNSFFYYLRVFD